MRMVRQSLPTNFCFQTKSTFTIRAKKNLRLYRVGREKILAANALFPYHKTPENIFPLRYVLVLRRLAQAAKKSQLQICMVFYVRC